MKEQLRLVMSLPENPIIAHGRRTAEAFSAYAGGGPLEPTQSKLIDKHQSTKSKRSRVEVMQQVVPPVAADQPQKPAKQDYLEELGMCSPS